MNMLLYALICRCAPPMKEESTVISSSVPTQNEVYSGIAVKDFAATVKKNQQGLINHSKAASIMILDTLLKELDLGCVDKKLTKDQVMGLDAYLMSEYDDMTKSVSEINEACLEFIAMTEEEKTSLFDKYGNVLRKHVTLVEISGALNGEYKEMLTEHKFKLGEERRKLATAQRVFNGKVVTLDKIMTEIRNNHNWNNSKVLNDLSDVDIRQGGEEIEFVHNFESGVSKQRKDRIKMLKEIQDEIIVDIGKDNPFNNVAAVENELIHKNDVADETLGHQEGENSNNKRDFNGMEDITSRNYIPADSPVTIDGEETPDSELVVISKCIETQATNENGDEVLNVAESPVDKERVFVEAQDEDVCKSDDSNYHLKKNDFVETEHDNSNERKTFDEIGIGSDTEDKNSSDTCLADQTEVGNELDINKD